MPQISKTASTARHRGFPLARPSHTFATWHRQAGTPTHELQRLGGWKTGAMVERYAHVAPEALQGAAQRLDAFGGYEMATPQRQTAQT
jgi:integrase